MAILDINTKLGDEKLTDMIENAAGDLPPLYGPVTTSGSGSAYTATISGLTSLVKGSLFVIIPHTTSTTVTPTLNVNSLGAKKLYLSRDDHTLSAYPPDNVDAYSADTPLLLMYDGSYFKVLNFNRVNWINILDKPSLFNPLTHASGLTTYGAGTSSHYGHVKLSDSYTTSQGSATDSVAASSSAVNDAYNDLSEKLFGNYADGRFTTWASIPAESGWFRVYDTSTTSGSTGQPTTSGSDYWTVLQLLSAYNSQTVKPTTNRYFIRFAFNMSNSTSISYYDMYYQKAYYNGTSWSGSSWYRIWNEYNDSQSPFLMNNAADSTSGTLRTTASVTNSSTTGYFRNIRVQSDSTAIPSSLTTGEILLVYEN